MRRVLTYLFIAIAAGTMPLGAQQPALRLARRRREVLGVALLPQWMQRGEPGQHVGELFLEVLAVLRRLAPFGLRLRRGGVQPRLDRLVLGVESRQIGYQVLDHRLVGQGMNGHGAAEILDRMHTETVVLEAREQLVQEAEAQAQVGVAIVEVLFLDIGLIEASGGQLELGVSVGLHVALGLPVELTFDLDQLIAK